MSNHLFDAIRAAAPGDATSSRRSMARAGPMLTRCALSGQIASAIDTLGVRPGDRVAVQVEKSAAALMLYLACLRCGAVYLPLNTAYTLAELDYFIGDAEPRLVVVSSKARGGVEKIAKPHGAIVETLDADGTGSLHGAGTRRACRLCRRRRAPPTISLRSSTRRARPDAPRARCSRTTICCRTRLTLRDCWRVTAADRLIHALPIFHTHGLFVATNVTLLAGASMFLLSKFEPDEVLSLMPQATLLMGVPTFYVRLLQSTTALTERRSPTCGSSSPARPRCLPKRISQFQAAHRSRHSRALRHDRNQYEHVEPL